MYITPNSFPDKGRPARSGKARIVLAPAHDPSLDSLIREWLPKEPAPSPPTTLSPSKQPGQPPRKNRNNNNLSDFEREMNLIEQKMDMLLSSASAGPSLSSSPPDFDMSAQLHYGSSAPSSSSAGVINMEEEVDRLLGLNPKTASSSPSSTLSTEKVQKAEPQAARIAFIEKSGRKHEFTPFRGTASSSAVYPTAAGSSSTNGDKHSHHPHHHHKGGSLITPPVVSKDNVTMLPRAESDLPAKAAARQNRKMAIADDRGRGETVGRAAGGSSLQTHSTGRATTERSASTGTASNPRGGSVVGHNTHAASYQHHNHPIHHMAQSISDPLLLEALRKRELNERERAMTVEPIRQPQAQSQYSPSQPRDRDRAQTDRTNAKLTATMAMREQFLSKLERQQTLPPQQTPHSSNDDKHQQRSSVSYSTTSSTSSSQRSSISPSSSAHMTISTLSSPASPTTEQQPQTSPRSPTLPSSPDSPAQSSPSRPKEKKHSTSSARTTLKMEKGMPKDPKSMLVASIVWNMKTNKTSMMEYIKLGEKHQQQMEDVTDTGDEMADVLHQIAQQAKEHNEDIGEGLDKMAELEGQHQELLKSLGSAYEYKLLDVMRADVNNYNKQCTSFEKKWKKGVTKSMQKIKKAEQKSKKTGDTQEAKVYELSSALRALSKQVKSHDSLLNEYLEKGALLERHHYYSIAETWAALLEKQLEVHQKVVNNIKEQLQVWDTTMKGKKEELSPSIALKLREPTSGSTSSLTENEEMAD
ncbi:hypothetical protein QOT17_007598 [Balamuthia mandrillaris]